VSRISRPGELEVGRLEHAARAEHLVSFPGRIAHVHDEPAVGGRSKTRTDVFERSLGHAASLTALPLAVDRLARRLEVGLWPGKSSRVGAGLAPLRMSRH
jgi:hypothetical protein